MAGPIDILALRAKARARFDSHATARMVELGSCETEVLHVLLNPRAIRPGGAGHPPGRSLYIGRRIAVVLAMNGRTVVTVLLAGDLVWTHGVNNVWNPPAAA